MSSINGKKRIMDLLSKPKSETGYYGFPDFEANTDDIISEVYTSPTYTDDERTKIAQWYSDNPVTVLPEFPRTVQDLPVLFVFRASDSESPNGLLGDLFDEDVDDDFLDVVQRGANFNESVTLECWAVGGGGARDDLYLATREIFIRGRDYLHLAGLEVPEWKSGKDSQMEKPEQRPSIIHTGTATITYRTSLTWNESADKILEFRANMIESGGRIRALPYYSEE